MGIRKGYQLPLVPINSDCVCFQGFIERDCWHSLPWGCFVTCSVLLDPFCCLKALIVWKVIFNNNHPIWQMVLGSQLAVLLQLSSTPELPKHPFLVKSLDHTSQAQELTKLPQVLSPAFGAFWGAEERRYLTCSTHWLGRGRLENRAAYTWSLKRSHLVLANRVLRQEQLELEIFSEGLRRLTQHFGHMLFIHCPHVLLKQAYMGKQEESEDRWRVGPFVVSDFLQVCGEMEVEDRHSLDPQAP